MNRCVKSSTIAFVFASLVVCAPFSLAGVRAVYSDDGIAELSVSENWAIRPDIGRTASLRVADGVNDNYLVVNTYPREEPLRRLSEYGQWHQSRITAPGVQAASLCSVSARASGMGMRANILAG